MPNFQVFPNQRPKTEADDPVVRLYESANIGLTRAAMELLIREARAAGAFEEPGSPEVYYMEFLFDAEEQVVGLRLVGEGNPTGHRTRAAGGVYMAPAKAFFRRMELPRGKRYRLQPYGGGVCGFSLKTGELS